MRDLILNSVTLDVLGLSAFVALLYLAADRRKRRPKPLRVVAGVRCWCKAFGSDQTDCYCVSFKEGSS